VNFVSAIRGSRFYKKMFDQFTLGIEEEFQIVDRTTGELRSHVSEILDEGKLLLGEKLKPEMIQSMIEVGTGVCRNIQEARQDISQLRCIISALARKKGLEIVAASTHPFSHWATKKFLTIRVTNLSSKNCKWWLVRC